MYKIFAIDNLTPDNCRNLISYLLILITLESFPVNLIVIDI